MWGRRRPTWGLHDVVARHQPDLHAHWIPQCVDTVHGDGERGGVADHRAAGVALLCGGRRTWRSELRLHRYRHVRIHWDLRTNANPRDTHADANSDANSNPSVHAATVHGNAGRVEPAGRVSRSPADGEYSMGRYNRFGYSGLKRRAGHDHGKSNFCRFGSERDSSPHSWSGSAGSERADYDYSD